MGSIIFEKGNFSDHLHEIIGYKSGVAASIEQMCDLLTESGYADEILDSEIYGLRIRAEEYEELYYTLLHKIGVTEKPYNGILEILSLSRRLSELNGEKFVTDIFDIYHTHVEIELELAKKENRKSLDPSNMLDEAKSRYGDLGFEALMELILEYERLRNYSPHSMNRWRDWGNVINLSDLFSKYQPENSTGKFFDQRFIDYLSVNQEQLGCIHWRKFEELIGECFSKVGYKVELGPGSNDDGVDLRVWNEDDNSSPEYIIQCKRQKMKINKVTI